MTLFQAADRDGNLAESMKSSMLEIKESKELICTQHLIHNTLQSVHSGSRAAHAGVEHDQRKGINFCSIS